MSDRFYKDIEVPDLSVSPPAPDTGFVQIYGKSGKLAYRNALGLEVLLEAAAAVGASIDGGNANTAYTAPAIRIDFGAAT